MISDANHTRGRRPESPAQESRDEAVRSWLTAIVQSSNDAIIGMTLDGTVTSWNPAAERLYGYTAEGVERADQLTQLVQMGCDMAQGYFFARPLPREEASRSLASGAFAALTAGAQAPPGPRPTRQPL